MAPTLGLGNLPSRWISYKLSFCILFSEERVLGVALSVPRADQRFPKVSDY